MTYLSRVPFLHGTHEYTTHTAESRVSLWLGLKVKDNSHSPCRLCLVACPGTSRESLGGQKPKNLKQSGEEGGGGIPASSTDKATNSKTPKGAALNSNSWIWIQGSVLPTTNVQRERKGKISREYWGTKKGLHNDCSCLSPSGKQILRWSAQAIRLGHPAPWWLSGKNLPANVGSLGREDPLKEEMATQSSILAWNISWTKEPGGLQPMGLQRVWHIWACTYVLLLSQWLL